MNLRKLSLVKQDDQIRVLTVFGTLGLSAILLQSAFVGLALTGNLGTDAPTSFAPHQLAGPIVRASLATLLAYVPLLAIVGLRLTDRIFGPIHSLENYFDAWSRGEDPGDCLVRRGDFAEDLSDRVNGAFDRVRADRERFENEIRRRSAA